MDMHISLYYYLLLFLSIYYYTYLLLLSKSFNLFTSQMIDHFSVAPPQDPSYTTTSFFSLLPIWVCLPTHPPSSVPLLQHPPILVHQTATGPWASPPIVVRQGHSLLPMYLEPWIPPCTLLGWWSSPLELWVVRPADVVLLIGLQSPSASPVLLPASSIGSLSSVCWLASSIHVYIGQLLAEPLKEQSYQVYISKVPLGKGNSVEVWCLQTGWIPR